MTRRASFFLEFKRWETALSRSPPLRSRVPTFTTNTSTPNQRTENGTAHMYFAHFCNIILLFGLRVPGPDSNSIHLMFAWLLTSIQGIYNM
jgi:hypothetical protein